MRAGPGEVKRVACFHAGSATCGHLTQPEGRKLHTPKGTPVVKAPNLMVEVSSWGVI